MKVKIIETGEIVEAKRLADLTYIEIEASIGREKLDMNLWDSKDIFVKYPNEEENCWSYMFDEEVEIIGEETNV